MAFGQSRNENKEKTTGQKVYEGFKKVRELSAKPKPKEPEDSGETEYDPKTKTYQKKKKAVEPTKGFMQRMMDKYIYGKKE
jgi:hypothetical protein